MTPGHEHEEDPVLLDDDDPELAAFFDGADLSADLVEDGGKDFTFLDAEPDREALDGMSNKDFWTKAQAAAEAGL